MKQTEYDDSKEISYNEAKYALIRSLITRWHFKKSQSLNKFTEENTVMNGIYQKNRPIR